MKIFYVRMKSMNMQMIKEFLRIEVDNNGVALTPENRENYKLFAGGELKIKNKIFELKPLQISKDEECMNTYQGKYPVIFIDMKDVASESYEYVFLALRS
jgi:hypothetical protein